MTNTTIAVGMKEVAKRAQVSIATVSAVVNNTKFVSDELRHRVEEAIKELGYRPNKVARRLKGKTSNIIGATVTEMTNPFYPYMLKGIEDSAKEQGFNLLLSTTGDIAEEEESIIDTMIDQGVDGVILSTVEDTEAPILKKLDTYGIPKVLINRVPEGYKGSYVGIDSLKVGELATKHLTNLGHSEIAFVGGNRFNSRLREKGFRKVLYEQGIPIREDWIINGDYDFSEAYKQTMKLFKKYNNKVPTAIFAASDVMAMGVIKGCLDLGLSVPHDVSVIGSDNILYSEYFKVSLTTVDVQAYRMGEEGFNALKSLIDSKENHQPLQLFLEPRLVVRESTIKQ
ncbi:LacI family DNA-binding transcriptional regulator [Oceanobacillus alkalisoli]|uniref:LacI family DNA-binding transcriptional regulator n=1 Tax=Oceanobacillus alkalisoli TaxID=2925113 RepID=UPI001F11F227|nr:LacI family DNA-binding transcriptional regulator [Oceanobacillus alkalisoli]MCF3942601.1 LacI family transcriptional regulator [Oceanobacillus alkalisoli]